MDREEKAFRNNRELALERFIRENRLALTDKGASKQAVRTLRLEFIRKHDLSSAAHFTNGEIANRVLEYLIRARPKASDVELLELTRSIPFLTEEIPKEKVAEKVTLLRLGRDSQIKPEELGKIQSEDYLTKVEDRFVQHARKEAEKQLADERRQLLSTITSLNETQRTLKAEQSQLDALPPDIDLETLVETTPDTDAGSGPAYWWKELGLETDPFSSNRGLTGIPEGKWESVVVQTPFVKSYFSRTDENPHAFDGKTVVILGEFGSGKTTLFKLLANRVGRRGIFPIFTSISPDSSVANLTLQFVSQINSILRESFPRRIEADQLSTGERVDEISRSLGVMTSALKSSTTTRGFLVFVDGLHTSDSDRRQSLEFLQHLQTLQERMEDRHIPCGILVAGSLTWERELTANKALGGSVYAIETVPALSEDSAVEAVVRRIHSFVPPSRPAPTIVRAPLRRAFELLTERLLRPPTFRDYLDHVRDRFVARDYSNLGVSIALHFETIERVRSAIEASPLAAAYASLGDKKSHSAAFRNVLRTILPTVCARQGLDESEPLFQRNKGAFYLLRKVGWIVSRANKTKTGLVWHLSPALVKFLQTIQESDRIVATEALESLFTDVERTRPQEVETIYGPVLRQMAGMAAAWRSTWPEVAQLLDSSGERITRLEGASETIEGLSSSSALGDLRSSEVAIIRAVLFVDGNKRALTDFRSDDFKQAWFAPENASEMLSLLTREIPPTGALSEGYGLLHEHAEAIGDLCSLLSDLVRGEGVSRLTGRLLSSEDASKLHAARILFLSQQYAQTVERLSEIVEAKIRDVVYPLLRAAMGDDCAKLLPRDIADKLALPPKGHRRAKREYDRNFLYDVSRSEYSKIVFQPIVRNLLSGESKQLEELVSLKDTMELLFSLGDRKSHNDRPSFFRDHSTEIADSLKAAPRVVEVLNRGTDRLLSAPSFEMKRATDGSISVAFEEGSGFTTHQFQTDEAENLITHVLERLERDPLRIPSLESGLLAIDQSVEGALAFLRGCVSFGLAEFSRAERPFRYEFRILDKGRQRLAKERTNPPTASTSQERSREPVGPT